MKIVFNLNGPEYASYNLDMEETAETPEEVGLYWLEERQEGQKASIESREDGRDYGKVLWRGHVITTAEVNTYDIDDEGRPTPGQPVTDYVL